MLRNITTYKHTNMLSNANIINKGQHFLWHLSSSQYWMPSCYQQLFYALLLEYRNPVVKVKICVSTQLQTGVHLKDFIRLLCFEWCMTSLFFFVITIYEGVFTRLFVFVIIIYLQDLLFVIIIFYIKTYLVGTHWNCHNSR